MKQLASILLFLCLSSGTITAQGKDLFNYKNSLEFAQFLNFKGDHSLAIPEWERLNLMVPGVDSLKIQLLHSYRMAGQWQNGRERFFQFYPGSKAYSAPIEISRELNHMLFLQKDFGGLSSFLSKHQQFDASYREPLLIALALRAGNMEEAHMRMAEIKIEDQALQKLVAHRDELKFKSRALAVGMSALLPGSGKAYAGSWQDGLVSLIFVGGAAFSAYRGFSQEGVNSAYGWIFGTISTGFYLGNLLGSAKAVKRYNNSVLDHYHADVEGYIYDRL